MRAHSACLSVLASLGLLASVSTSSASLLVNGSFESGGEVNWNPSGTVTWTTGWTYTAIGTPDGAGNNPENGWVWLLNSPAPRTGQDGNRYLETHRYIIQTNAVNRPEATPGIEYTLDFLYTKKSNQVWDAPQVYIDFYDNNTAGQYAPISSAQISLPNYFAGTGLWDSQFVAYTISAVAPAGATHVGVRFDARDNQWGNVAVDNFVLTAIPEPATGGLLGMAAAGLLVRRSRRMA